MNMPLQIECTLFFQENPYTFETLNGIALRLGRNPDDIKLALEHLMSISILEMIGEGEQAIYRYIAPKYSTKSQVPC
jgi:hypothetical protein